MGKKTTEFPGKTLTRRQLERMRSNLTNRDVEREAREKKESQLAEIERRLAETGEDQ